MIAFIRGSLFSRSPTFVVLETAGVGYLIHISLFTYAALPETGEVVLYTQQVIREDAHLLYGFATESEKALFSLLTSVSGIGPSTGRMMLSSMDMSEIEQAIIRGDVERMKQIKGIGLKSAQRIILELQDKLTKESVTPPIVIASPARDEATRALVTLGFAKAAAEKAVEKVLSSASQTLPVGAVIKQALKIL